MSLDSRFTEQAEALVALVGNPNAGKTSLFNALTGSTQKVGNYPGVTVEKVTGELRLDGRVVACVDVPGIYSLRPISADERVASAVIAGCSGEPRPDLLVVVLDGANLERNLFLFSQIAELGMPTVVALTMGDVLHSSGRDIDTEELARALGVDVVRVVAHKDAGLDELKAAIARNLDAPRTPTVALGYPKVVSEAVESLRERFARSGLDMERLLVREALLHPQSQPAQAVANSPELLEALKEARRLVAGSAGQGRTLDAQTRYAWASSVRRAVLSGKSTGKPTVTDKIDALLTHRVFGLAFFAAVMYGLFLSIYTLAAPLTDGIQSGTQGLAKAIGPALSGMPTLRSLVVDGLLTGVGSVLSFLPQILILFVFIALLEGSGYLARGAFLMDRLFGWCGLNGRSFIPLLSSFACGVPGVMAARVIPDSRSRLATILVAPLMSCSARLPVYVLFIGAVIQPRYGAAWAATALFAMHFVGALVAIPVVTVLQKGVLRGPRMPFLLELPPYQWPRLRDIRITLVSRAKVYLRTAGTIIFAMSIVVWALLYFPRSPEAEGQYQAQYATLSSAQKATVTEEAFVADQFTHNSYLGRFGRAIEPAFAPTGFDWRLATAILAAFPARETVISALGIMFDLGNGQSEDSGDLRTALREARRPDGSPLVTPAVAFGMMLFFALCCQCMATLAAVRRETNSWAWAAFTFAYMTILAYGAAALAHQAEAWLR